MLNDLYRSDKSNMYRMVLTPFMVLDNVQVWHKSTIGVYAGMLHLGLLQSLKYSHMSQIYSGLPRCHDSLSTKNEIIQTGESSSLIFYLIYIVCQIPMVEMFATNISHKPPFYVASPGCRCSEHI